jgi:hypothetical protein
MGRDRLGREIVFAQDDRRAAVRVASRQRRHRRGDRRPDQRMHEGERRAGAEHVNRHKCIGGLCSCLRAETGELRGMS